MLFLPSVKLESQGGWKVIWLHTDTHSSQLTSFLCERMCACAAWSRLCRAMLFCVDTGIHVEQADLRLSAWPRMTLNRCCFCLSGVGITGTCVYFCAGKKNIFLSSLFPEQYLRTDMCTDSLSSLSTTTTTKTYSSRHRIILKIIGCSHFAQMFVVLGFCLVILATQNTTLKFQVSFF